MPGKARKFVRVIKFLLAGVCVFCVSWLACVSEWRVGGRWAGGAARWAGAAGRRLPTTMRTIVAYSAAKQAEMERPSPLACDTLPEYPLLPNIDQTWSPAVKQQSWQVVSGTRVSLFAAYYDDRSPQRYVRILATFHGRNKHNFSSEDTLFCQTRSLNPDEDSVEVVTARPLEIWWHKWDASSEEVDTPLLLSCPLTESLLKPSIVSVVTQPCEDPLNAFLLTPTENNKIHEFENRRNFTICVKDMNFHRDISQNLVEWIEINRILGVDLIDMYVGKVSMETEDILRHYQAKGFVRLFNVPISDQNRTLWQRRRDHIVTYNDCLYRNIKESEFIIPLDVDEVVLPKVAETLPELLSRLKKYGWNPSKMSAVMIRNRFFFDFMQGISRYRNNTSIENQTYIKRDDVRIKTITDELDIKEVELLDDASDINNVINVNYLDKVSHETNCGAVVTVPKLTRHIVSSAIVSSIKFFAKSLMVTKNVLTVFNHYPLHSQSFTVKWAAPFNEVQLNHYKESCNSTIMEECTMYGRQARIDTSALRFHRRLLSAIEHLHCSRI